MIAQPIAPGIYRVSLGFVNVFLIDVGELTLIDTGISGSERKINQAIEELGKKPGDLRHILITHFHADHTGSLAVLQKATGAQTYMHPLDGESYSRGISIRPVQSAPGLLNKLITQTIRSRPPSTEERSPIHHEIQDGQIFDFAGGLRAIYTPGHTAGHVGFLSPAQGGVLIAGDVCSHMLRLGYSFIYEDFEEGKRTLRRLGELNFEIACFSHGKPLLPKASQQLRARFGT